MAKKQKCPYCGKAPLNPHLDMKQRMALYPGMLAQGLGTKRMHYKTGIPISTIKDDLRRLRKAADDFGDGPTPRPAPRARGSGKAPLPTPAPTPAGNGPAALQPAGKDEQPFDWGTNLDKIGKVLLGLFSQAVQGHVKCDKCGHLIAVMGDQDEAMKILDRFQRLYSAKMGGLKVAFLFGDQGGADQDPINLERIELMEMLKALDSGPNCLLCGKPKDGPDIVDADFKVQEDPNGSG